MHDKICLGRTGRYTSEYRSTFTMSYRYEMPDRIVYFDEEAVQNAYLDNYKGHTVQERNDCRFGGRISHDDKILLKSVLSRGTLEPYHIVVVFEYEVDYE